MTKVDRGGEVWVPLSGHASLLLPQRNLGMWVEADLVMMQVSSITSAPGCLPTWPGPWLSWPRSCRVFLRLAGVPMAEMPRVRIVSR